MITLQEICTYLTEILEPHLFEDYCPNGLQVEGKKEICSIATAVTASLETIEKAVALNADALFVHHGLFWNRDSYSILGIKREKIALLLQHQLSLFAYHLPLDAHKEMGNNWKAARELGWVNLQPFADVGVMGSLPKKITPMQLQTQLEQYYQHPAATVLSGVPQIETVALISGGAHKSLSKAVNAKVDAFVTGSFDEPVWHTAREEQVHFFALGHSATEKVGIMTLGKHLAEKFGLSVQFLDDANPF